MVYEKEINDVKNILKNKFSSVDDRLYWENKLVDLKQKQFTAKQNQDYFKSYEKGVKAFKNNYPYKY